VAAALVAAGLLAHVSQRPTLVQVLVLSAVGVWLVAVMLFLWAVAVDVSAPDPNGLSEPGWTTGCDFLRSVSRDVRAELDAPHTRLRSALTATVIALELTISALVGGTVDPNQASREKAHIAVSAQAASALGRLCGSKISDVYATIDPADLSTAVVSLELPAGECGDTATTIREPRTAIGVERRIKRFPDDFTGGVSR